MKETPPTANWHRKWQHLLLCVASGAINLGALVVNLYADNYRWLIAVNLVGLGLSVQAWFIGSRSWRRN